MPLFYQLVLPQRGEQSQGAAVDLPAVQKELLEEQP